MQRYQNKNCLRWPCLLTDRNETSNLYRGLPTKFQFIWSSGFSGEDFYKSTNQKQELPMAAMILNRSGQNEQS